MIQATNELILGMELNEQYAQLTYYHQSVREPVTLGTNADAQQYRMPNGLRLTAQGKWQLFDGTPQIHGEEPDHCRICGVYGKADRGELIEENGHSFEPEEILSIYFECCMAGLKLLTQNTKLQVMVTVKELTEERSSLLTGAWMRLGLARRDIYVQDYLSSFYYYTVNQKKELWYHDAALFTYEDEAIVGYILHIDKSTKPAIAKAECVARQPLDDSVRAQRTEENWQKEKDRLFFELLLFEPPEEAIINNTSPIRRARNIMPAVNSHFIRITIIFVLEFIHLHFHICYYNCMLETIYILRYCNFFLIYEISFPI